MFMCQRHQTNFINIKSDIRGSSPQLATQYVKLIHCCSTMLTSQKHAQMTLSCSGFVAKSGKSTQTRSEILVFPSLSILSFSFSPQPLHTLQGRQVRERKRWAVVWCGMEWNVNEVCSETWDTLSYGPPPEVQPYRSCVKPPPDFSSVPIPGSQ